MRRCVAVVLMGALAFAPGLPLTAQTHADPVETWRSHLAIQFGDDQRAQMKHRASMLAKDVAALKTVSQMRAALMLAEWRDSGENSRVFPEVATVDRQARGL